MWPADRLFDKMKNLVEQPLQKAPGVQNFVSMETVRVISCQTFEKKLLWKVSFHHQSFIVGHHLALEGQVVPRSHSQGGKNDENQRRTWGCIGIISKSCLCPGTTQSEAWLDEHLVTGECPRRLASLSTVTKPWTWEFFNTLHLRSTLEMVSEKEGPLDSDTSGLHKWWNYDEEDP